MSLGKLKHISGNSSLPGSDTVCVFPYVCVSVCMCEYTAGMQEGKYAVACNLRVYSRFHMSEKREAYLFSVNMCFHSNINFPQMSTKEVWMMDIYKSISTMRHKKGFE